MDLKKLREILRIVAESDVAEVEIDEDGAKVTIRKDAPTVMVQSPGYFPPPSPYYLPPGAPTVPSPAAYPDPAVPAVGSPPAHASDIAQTDPGASANETVVRAPIVGTYYQAPSPDAELYVKVGSAVTEGTVLCIIEAMKLMNEIESEVTGTIKQILVQDSDPVEYDQPLFVIETS